MQRLLLYVSFFEDCQRFSWSEMVIIIEFESSIPGPNPGKILFQLLVFWQDFLMLLVLDSHLTGLQDMSFWLFTTHFTAQMCTIISLSWYNTRWADIWVYTASPVICITTALLLTTIFYTSLNHYLLFVHLLFQCIIKYNLGPNALIFYPFFLTYYFTKVINTQHKICWYQKPHPPVICPK